MRNESGKLSKKIEGGIGVLFMVFSDFLVGRLR